MAHFSNTPALSRRKSSFCTSSRYRFFLALLLLLAVMVANMMFRPTLQDPLPVVPKESLGGNTIAKPTTTEPPTTAKPRTTTTAPPRLDHPADAARVFTTKDVYSDAPKPIELRIPSSANKNIASSSVLERAIQQRHQCLSFIRQRHSTLLGPLVQRHSHNVLLVDPAYHANVGDHMLTVAEQVIIQNYTAKWQECHYLQAKKKAPTCASVIGSSFSTPKLAMWHAGGNWGDVWKTPHKVRIDSFLPLLRNNYTLLSMPQSLHYYNNHTQRQDAALIQRLLEEGLVKGRTLKEQVTFTWREKHSFQRAQELYPYVTNLMVPDVAFQLGPYERTNPPSVDILVFLRNDAESKYRSVAKGNTGYIKDKLQHSNMTFTMVDWPDRLKKFHSQDVLFTRTSIQLLSLGKVVIADRLHASILAYLMGLPFVYLDQSTNKLTKTLSVAFDSWPHGCNDNETSLWSKATNLDEALEKAVDYIKRYQL